MENENDFYTQLMRRLGVKGPILIPSEARKEVKKKYLSIVYGMKKDGYSKQFSLSSTEAIREMETIRSLIIEKCIKSTEETDLQMYDIYIEGFQCTGDRAYAKFVGLSMGSSFVDACQKYYKQYPDTSYNEESNTVWGCNLFPTLEEAQKSFG